MIKKIERPQWFDILAWDDTEKINVNRKRLEVWFNENVEPINKVLDEAPTVYRKSNMRAWHYNKDHPDGHSHTALLINIKPFKHETCKEALKNLVDWCEDNRIICASNELKNAKAALERES